MYYYVLLSENYLDVSNSKYQMVSDSLKALGKLSEKVASKFLYSKKKKKVLFFNSSHSTS